MSSNSQKQKTESKKVIKSHMLNNGKAAKTIGRRSRWSWATLDSRLAKYLVNLIGKFADLREQSRCFWLTLDSKLAGYFVNSVGQFTMKQIEFAYPA